MSAPRGPDAQRCHRFACA